MSIKIEYFQRNIKYVSCTDFKQAHGKMRTKWLLKMVKGGKKIVKVEIGSTFLHSIVHDVRLCSYFETVLSHRDSTLFIRMRCVVNLLEILNGFINAKMFCWGGFYFRPAFFSLFSLPRFPIATSTFLSVYAVYILHTMCCTCIVHVN